MEKSVKLTWNGMVFEGSPSAIAKIIASAKTDSVIANKGTVVLRKGAELKKIFATINADTAEEFVLKALDKAGQGIHTVFSGLNDTIRNRFHRDPKDVIVVETATMNGRTFVSKVTVGDQELKGHFAKGGLSIGR